MRRTDDFLTDLEAQLGAAAAGRLRPRRRVRVAHLLRPALVVAAAAAAIFAFVLAAGTLDDPERAADPPPPPAGSGPFELQMAHRGMCAADPGRAEIPTLSVLRRPQSARAASDSPSARMARADAPVTVVPMADVGSCVFDGSKGPGACVIVDLDGRRAACWALRDIESGRAVAGLGGGFVVALLPDRMSEVTFVIGAERDTYRATDNVVIGNLEGAKEGAHIELLTGTAPPAGCADGTSEGGPLPGELTLAIPLLGDTERQAPAPDDAIALLRRSGAERVWHEQVRALDAGDGAQAWVVPVADSRFAECDEPLIHAPREWDGPGACVVATVEGRSIGAHCADLDELAGFTAPQVPGGRLAIGFAPHGATELEVAGTVIPIVGGVAAGRVDDRDQLSYTFRGPSGDIDSGHAQSQTVGVLAADPAVADAVRRRLVADGVRDVRTGVHDSTPRSRVLYAAGMARGARQVAELLRVQDVLPLDPETAQRADAQAAVVVVAGDDLRP